MQTPLTLSLRVALFILTLTPSVLSAQSTEWVRFYKGTWGTQTVAVNLTREGTIIHGHVPLAACEGNCTIEGQLESGSTWSLQVMHPQDGSAIAKWLVTLGADGNLSGAEEGNPANVVMLKPDCSLGSLQFELVTVTDSQRLKVNVAQGTEIPRGFFSFQYYKPVKGRNYEELKWAQVELKTAIFGEMADAGSPEQILASQRDTFFADYQSIAADWDTLAEPWFFTWEAEAGTRIMHNEKGILLYEIDYSSYTGGAHGGYAAYYIILDVQNQHRIEYGDIFPDDERTKAKLSKLLEENFLAERNEMGAGMKKVEEELFEDHIDPNTNLYFTEDGIGFFYNEYEIAPYSSGPVEILISWKEAAKLMLPGCALRRIMPAN